MNKKLLLILFLTIITVNIQSQQANPLQNNKIYLGESFDIVKLKYKGIKWFGSSYNGEKRIETYIYHSKIWDFYFKYNVDEYNHPIVAQSFFYVGNKITARKYFSTIIGFIKAQGGYTELNNPNHRLYQFFYTGYTVIVDLNQVEGSPIYGVNISIDLAD